MHVKFDVWKMINSKNGTQFEIKILIQLNIWDLMALYPPSSLQLQPYHPKHLILFNDIFHWICPISPTCCGNTRCITCTFFCETCLWHIVLLDKKPYAMMMITPHSKDTHWWSKINIFLQVFPLATFSFGPICQSRALVGCFFLLWNFDKCFDFWPVFWHASCW